MYQLLIVDDEISVVDSLALTIPWEEYGIETVHRAYSAKEALDIAAKQAIDIMITDIRMPEMNGLELIEEIRRFSRKMRCIILSGHDEFEYAQKAIEYQTINYLLKPVEIDVLTDAVKNAIQHIEREWADISSYHKLKQTLHANIPLLRSQLLQDLLKNRHLRTEVLLERLELTNLNIRPGDPYMMMVIRLEEDFSNYDPHSLSLLEFAVTNIAEEVFQAVFDLWHCITDQGYLVFLIHSKDHQSYSLVDSYAVKLQTHVQKFLKGSLTICMGHIEVFPDGISDVYLSSVSAINRKAGKYKDYFITLDHPPSIEQNPNHITDLFKPPSLSSLLESGRWDEALDKVRQILAMDKPHHEFSLDQLYVILLHLSSCFTIAFISEGIPLEEQIEEELDSLLRKKALLTRNKINHWAERMMASLKSKTSDQIEDSHLQIASKVRTFIQENLAEGITLQIIADHIGLHPVYLSKVYKTVTHETIGDYIFRTRMERAAYLLRNTDLKIMEISAQLGFFATPHFIKIFKKHYGCTPQEYRNKDTYLCK